MIKDILVSLPIGRLSDSAVNYAVSVAEAFEAHLTGVAFVHKPFVSIIGSYVRYWHKADIPSCAAHVCF